MSGIQLKLLADTSNLIKGSKDAAKSLDGVVDSLEELAREGETTERSVDDNLDAVARSGDSAGDKLERSFREAFDAAKKESREASRDVSRNTERAFDDAGGRAGEFKDEARANFSEVVSSFDGSMDSIADLAQGTLGGIAGTWLGPAGLIAGAGAAAFGGLYAAAKANTERTKQRVADMYEDMMESGDKFLSDSYKLEAYWGILKNDDGAVLSLDKANEYAKLLNISVQEVALAWSGNEEQMTKVIDGLTAKRDEYQRQTKTGTEEEKQHAIDMVTWYDSVITKAEARNSEIATTIDQVSKSRAAWDAWGTTANDNLDSARQAYGDARAEAEKFNDELGKTPSSVTVDVKVDADDVRTQVTNALRRSFPIGVTVGTRYGQGIQ